MDEYGTVDTIRANWAENFAQTQDTELLDAHKRAAIQSYVNHFLVEKVRLLEHRVTSGRIRDGHGDLHAASVCTRRRRLYLFDCIEFNPRFRCADVLSVTNYETGHALVWEPSHPDGGFDCTTRSAHVQQSILALDDVHNSEVEIWTQPPIHVDLRVTVLAALLEAGKSPGTRSWPACGSCRRIRPPE